VTKKYGEVVAIDNLSLTVEAGEILGILGQNGAGKTTLIEMMEGLRRPDIGTITVAGFPHILNNRDYYKKIGVQLQNGSLQDELKVGEVLQLFALFHNVPVNRALALLERFHLSDKQNTMYQNLSAGQARIVQLVLTFFHEPNIAFLDEPSAGLDPLARRELWDFVRQHKAQGQTVILTTHYVEEAEEMCDRVAILDKGQVVRLGSPRQLIAESVTPHKIAVYHQSGVRFDLNTLPGISRQEEKDAATFLYTDNYLATLKHLTTLLEKRSEEVSGLTVQKTRLEDVYIKLLGKQD
jgi:ABC-2 type transport system ATP-binding protein